MRPWQRRAAPAFAVVDLRLGDGNGLDVVSALKRKRPDARAIVLTGYGNIATAVTAGKMGAGGYLSKPAAPCSASWPSGRRGSSARRDSSRQGFGVLHSFVKRRFRL